MRPVTKLSWPQENGINKVYKPHTIAKTDLELNLDCFCSYCEVFSSDLEVEHVISQDQDGSLIYNGDNFLLACGRCNGRDNKTNKAVNLSLTHFPHLNNTYLSFVYKEGGYVVVNPVLIGKSLSNATKMINLVGLDKIPGNPKYPNLIQTDTRWRHRRVAWEWAKKFLPQYEAGDVTAQQIVDFARQRGFFSVWFTVYAAHRQVRELLIHEFIGTAQNCFDANSNFDPLPRNPHVISDPV
jgi:hypothetical protein